MFKIGNMDGFFPYRTEVGLRLVPDGFVFAAQDPAGFIMTAKFSYDWNAFEAGKVRPATFLSGSTLTFRTPDEPLTTTNADDYVYALM